MQMPTPTPQEQLDLFNTYLDRAWRNSRRSNLRRQTSDSATAAPAGGGRTVPCAAPLDRKQECARGTTDLVSSMWGGGEGPLARRNQGQTFVLLV